MYTMYLPENVLFYGEQEEGTDKSTFLEPHFTATRFKLLQAIVLSQQKAHTFFSSSSPLYVLLRTNTMDTFL